MRKHFVLGGKGSEAWLFCPKHDDMFMQATGSSGFGTDEDCIGCLAAEQAWDEGHWEGWQNAREALLTDMFGGPTLNPYREETE